VTAFFRYMKPSRRRTTFHAKKSAPLGADVDAILAGASEADADNIARAIEARPWPTYEERMAVFSPAGPWKSSRESTTG
jgi:hypothetical protein